MSATVELAALLAIQGIRLYTEYLEATQVMTEDELIKKWKETNEKVSIAMMDFEAEMEKNLED